MTDIERFNAKTEPCGDCLRWTGRIQPNGYGQFRLNGKRTMLIAPLTSCLMVRYLKVKLLCTPVITGGVSIHPTFR